jgi:hypothetical protein
MENYIHRFWSQLQAIDFDLAPAHWGVASLFVLVLGYLCLRGMNFGR